MVITCNNKLTNEDINCLSKGYKAIVGWLPNQVQLTRVHDWQEAMI